MSPLSIILTAVEDLVTLEGDNTALIQHLTAVANNIATANLVALHPEVMQTPAAPAEPVKVPEGEPIH